MTIQPTTAATPRRLAALLLKGAAALTLSLATVSGVAQTAGSYSLTNIISDGYVPATVTDPGFIDPWGISGPSDFWIDTAVTGYSYVNFANGAIQFKTTIPAASGTGTGQPTGTVFNSTTGFLLSNGSKASFLFASLDGSIWGWNGKLGTTGSISLKAIDNSAAKAVYTDIALDPSAGGTVLLAANFGAGAKVEVYNQSFASTTLAGSFTDPNVPAGYAPYAVHIISNQVYVTYMLRSTTTYSETLGTNTGFISVFDVNGNFLKRAITGGNLNAPWGMALAPTGFGIYGGDLLVGNLGDGLINVYDPNTYAYLGQITDATGAPILSKYPGAGAVSSYVGLWEIVFGNGVVNGTPSTTNAGDPNTLYFAAGLDAETHGVFGSISQNAATGGTANFGFSTSSSVATVANDASTSLTVAVAPINGFSGPVTFTCSGLPVNSTCNFSSPTLTVTPSASATETLTISTGGYKASNEAAPFLHSGNGSYTALAFMPFACVLLFAGRKKLRINPKWMLVLIGAVGAVTLVGCSYTNTTTPAGTTAVTITATSGATNHTSTVNLTVQ
jgi:uncharacterized protein (TIGR03118 family)